MAEHPKLPRMAIDLIRENTLAFLKQAGGDTTVLMPMLPKRILILCDTIDAFYDEQEAKSDAKD